MTTFARHAAIRARRRLVASCFLVTIVFSIGVTRADPISILDTVRVVDPSLTVSVKWITTSTPACSPLPPGYEWVCGSAGPLSTNDVGEDAVGQHYYTGQVQVVPDTVANTQGWPLQRIDSQGHIATAAYLLSQRVSPTARSASQKPSSILFEGR